MNGSTSPSFRKPRHLHPDDRIAILSPSWGGPHLFPGIYEKGLEMLQRHLGLQPVEFPTARQSPSFLDRNPRARADDINAAYADDSIAGIVASVGGDDSVRILKHLDSDTITANPKMMMGYSDFTTLLAAVSGFGNVTLHGPGIMAGIAQMEALGQDYIDRLRDLLLGNRASVEYRASSFYSNGYPDWAVVENMGKIAPPEANEGWKWVQKAERREGYFWGGCIEVLEFMKGTDFWPERSFFDDKFLLLETSEEAPSPHRVSWFLRNYGVQTIIDRIQGIVFGRPRDYTNEQKRELELVVKKVVIEEFDRRDIPIVMDFDVGHTDPQFVVPFGIRAEIDSEHERVALLEPIFDGA